MYPSTFFGLFPPFPYEERAFVAMSFDPMFDNRWNNVIVPAIKAVGMKDVTLEPHRVDLRNISDSILTEILNEIRKCRVFIGDITSIGSIKGRPIPNPNVMYEIGLAQAVRLPEEVILFRSDEGERPFDISNIRVHQYDPDNNPDMAKNLVSKTIVNSLNELKLQQHLAVKHIADSLDFQSWTVLLEVYNSKGLNHPPTKTVGQVLGAISRTSAISKLLENGVIRADYTKVTPEKLKSIHQEATEQLVIYNITSLGKALVNYLANTMITPEIRPTLKELADKEFQEEGTS